MKRCLLFILSIGIVLGCAAGCAFPRAKQTAPVPAESRQPRWEQEQEGVSVGNGTLRLTEEPVELKFWLPVNSAQDPEDPEAVLWTKLTQEFQKEYPNVTFDLIGEDRRTAKNVWENLGEYQLPDLVGTPVTPLYAENMAGAAADCAPYLSEDYHAAYFPSLLEAANEPFGREGAVYVTPYEIYTAGWVFNTEILASCNLEVPDTWEALCHCAEVLRGNGILPVCHGGADSWAIWGYHGLFRPYGWTRTQYEQLSSGKVPARETAFYQGFTRIYELAAAGAFAAEAGQTRESTAEEQYGTGQAAIIQIYGSWIPARYRQCVSDPEANAGLYSVMESSVFRLGFQMEDGLVPGGGICGVKQGSRMVMVGKKTEEDLQKLAACVAFLEFLVRESTYPLWEESGYVDATPLIWAQENAPASGGLLSSYYEALAADGLFTGEPTVYAGSSQTMMLAYREAVTGLICGTLDVEEACSHMDTGRDGNTERP